MGHAVLDAQHDNLEHDTDGVMFGFRHAVVVEAELGGDTHINIAALTGFQQITVGGDAHLLLHEVSVDEHAPRRWRNQKPDPLSRPEYVPRVRRRVAAGLGAESPERSTVTAVSADRQLIQPKLGERGTHLT